MANAEVSLADKLTVIAINGFAAGAVNLGIKLKLFDALAEVSSPENPATPEQVAEKSKCKPRYIKEWLALLSSSGIVEVNKEERFWIKPENIEVLTTNNMSLLLSSNAVQLLGASEKLAEVFKEEGPRGTEYSDYKGIFDQIDQNAEAMHKKHLISDLLPLIDKELANRLTNDNLMCLDVGCGSGFHVTHLAEHFPNSRFTGIDVTLDAVIKSNQKRHDDGKTFENVAFIQMNAAKMDEDWKDKYDVVFIFDACHDQTRPDLCLKEVFRVLKPGGVFAMLETAGHSNIHDNKSMGILATSLYGFSLFHCLPVGSNSEDAVCAGALWGQEMACRLLEEAGFKDIRVEPTPQFVINQLYVCKK